MPISGRGGNFIKWAILQYIFLFYLTKTCCLSKRTLIQCDKTIFNKVGVLTFSLHGFDQSCIINGLKYIMTLLWNATEVSGGHNFTLNYIRKSSNDIFSWTANGNLTKLNRNGPWVVLYQSCSYGSDWLHK